jgi:hypothetical protein
MPNYHIYFMLKGAPVGSKSIEAGDDAEAVRIASTLNEGDAVELWNDYRRLKVFGASPARAASPAGQAPVEFSVHNS